MLESKGETESQGAAADGKERRGEESDWDDGGEAEGK